MLVHYKPTFIRQYNKLENSLQEEVLVSIEQFKNPENHAVLRVHKLRGNMKGLLAFSVNYAIRVVFEYETKDEAVLLAVGDHDIYK
jgi:mRNA-degrading endonuclease YafQ of YafQ-DinJ toxin-antitoxin module